MLKSRRVYSVTVSAADFAREWTDLLIACVAGGIGVAWMNFGNNVTGFIVAEDLADIIQQSQQLAQDKSKAQFRIVFDDMHQFTDCVVIPGVTGIA